MNPKTLVCVHGYAGDAHQIEALMPMYEHHQCPILILSPEDSPVPAIGPHHRRFAGKRAYIGQDSLDRQWLQMKALLSPEYQEFDYFLLNDADSFVLTPELPKYLYEDGDIFYSNQVTDFRLPGQEWVNPQNPQERHTWPQDYHAGHPLIAMQPPYFLNRKLLKDLLCASTLKHFLKEGQRNGIKACSITPFIDWYMVQMCVKAGAQHKPFQTGASCETVTPHGIAVMSQCIREHGATFIHSVKSREVMERLVALYKTTL